MSKPKKYIDFNILTKLVEDGLMVNEAIKKMGYSERTVYNNLSKDQKRHLQILKTLNTLAGTNGGYGSDTYKNVNEYFNII